MYTDINGYPDPCVVEMPGYERPTFCLVCGVAEIEATVQHGTRGWRCANCGTGGDRWYIPCPDHACDNAFCHLHSPLRVDRREDGRIAYAEGVAWCDACGHLALYQWRKNEWEDAQMAVVAWSGREGSRIAFTQNLASELMQTSS